MLRFCWFESGGGEDVSFCFILLKFYLKRLFRNSKEVEDAQCVEVPLLPSECPRGEDAELINK